MIESKIVGISYEDVEDKNGRFPLLRPMSEIAGKGGFLMACQFSQKINGGRGLMLARVHAVRTPVIEIIGAGVAGLGAAGLGNKVIMLARRNYLQFILWGMTTLQKLGAKCTSSVC